MLTQERLILRPMEDSDSDIVIKWRNTKKIMDGLFSERGITIKQHQKWYEDNVLSGKRIEFIILIKDEERRIGTVGLSNIDSKNQIAELGILLDPKEWKKGFGREANKIIIEYAFMELNINKVYLRVLADNQNAIKMYKSIGFNEEGILKKHVYKNGSFKDIVNMAIFREEWENAKSGN